MVAAISKGKPRCSVILTQPEKHCDKAQLSLGRQMVLQIPRVSVPLGLIHHNEVTHQGYMGMEMDV